MNRKRARELATINNFNDDEGETLEEPDNLDQEGPPQADEDGEGEDPNHQPESPLVTKRRTTARQKYAEAAEEHRENKRKIDEEWTQRGAASHLRANTFQTTIPKTHYDSNNLIHEVIDEKRGPKICTSPSLLPQVPFASEVHPSHRKMLLRSIVFCKKCGYWSSKKTQKLSDPCLNEPQHSDGRAKLKRMTDGYHPDRKLKQWVDGLSTSIKIDVLCLDS